MAAQTSSFTIETSGKGTYELTHEIERKVAETGLSEGVVTVFVRHTSASLVIMENADPSARVDLEAFFDRLVPEDSDYFIHTHEGPDDMPSHIRMSLTRTSEVIPLRTKGELCSALGRGFFFLNIDARPIGGRFW